MLAALKGQTHLPPGFQAAAGRTASLGASVQYSLAHLDEATRRLLPAVALFEGVADLNVLTLVSQDEDAPAWLRGVSRDQWTAALDAAAGVGLLTRLGGPMFRMHPALPAYLTAAWRSREPVGYPAEVAAAQRALIGAFATLGTWLHRQIRQGEAAKALATIGLQRRSLGTALAAALAAQRYRDAQAILEPLVEFWHRRGLTQEALAWGDRCRVRLEAADGTPPPLDTPGGALWLFAVGDRAERQREALELDAAQATYEAIRVSLEAQPDSQKRSRRLAITYHQLGIVTQDRGELDRAEDWYRQSLTIKEQLGDRLGMARSYHQLGIVAQLSGELDRAEEWYRQSRTILGQLGDRRGMARSYHHLGMVAQDRGELDRAEEWYRQSLAIEEQLGNRPGMAGSYHQLGIVAQKRGELDRAEEWYRHALTIDERLGNRLGMALTYGQLGLVAETRQQPAIALEQTVRCVALFDQFPHPSTGQGPRHLARLTRQLGIGALEETWTKVTGGALPATVRAYVERTRNDEQER